MKLAKIAGIDNLDESAEKRTQAYQQYYDYMNKQQVPTAKANEASSATVAEKASTTVEQSYDGDTYQKATTTMSAAYDSKGKKTVDFSAYTKTKFVADSPPDVSSDQSSQLFDSLDENKDHLLENNEYTKDSITKKEPPKSET